jgi:hypothetical protein
MPNESDPRTKTSSPRVRVQASAEIFSKHIGSIALRELDDTFCLVPALAKALKDPRFPELCEYSTIDLLRLRLFSFALGYRNQIDVDALTEDPAFVSATLDRPLTQFSTSLLPSQSTLSRFTEILSASGNVEILRKSVISFSRLANLNPSIDSVTLDIDPFPIQAHGKQPGSAYNGYYKSTVFCPMLVSVAETSDFVYIALREGQNNSFSMASEILKEAFDAVRAFKPVKLIRCDAGFYSSDFLNGIRALGCDYVIRRKSAQYIELLAEPIIVDCLKSATEPTTIAVDISLPKEHIEEGRRVILVIEVEGRSGELIPFNHFYLETSYDKSVEPLEVVSIYRQRGTFEAQIGQFNQATRPALMSSPRRDEETKRRRVEESLAPKPEKKSETSDKPESAPRSAQAEHAYAMNEATLLLFVLARNLLNLLRDFVPRANREGAPERPSLRTVQKNVLNIVGRLIRQGREFVFGCAQESLELLAEVMNAIRRAAMEMAVRSGAGNQNAGHPPVPG